MNLNPRIKEPIKKRPQQRIYCQISTVNIPSSENIIPMPLIPPLIILKGTRKKAFAKASIKVPIRTNNK